ncbi:MAG: LysR family transcriptional regulator [Pseudomonadota bacterium]
MFDWSLLQSFADVEAHGSLSAAARATGKSQPTLSRHISSLEQQTGSRLFTRNKNGVALTVMGAALLKHVHGMAEAAAHLRLAIDGNPDSLSGTIRITASQIMATYTMPALLTRLQHAEPEIDIEMVASDETENLLQREADIAVRMYRPTQPDVITRKVGEIKLGMFASKAYLDRRGMPKSADDLLKHTVIGYDRKLEIIEGFRQAGLKVDQDFFAFRSDDQVVCWQMVRAGYGIGFNQIRVGEADPDLVRIDIANPVGRLPIWLTAHAELRSSPRVRRVYDFLAEQLGALTA